MESRGAAPPRSIEPVRVRALFLPSYLHTAESFGPEYKIRLVWSATFEDRRRETEHQYGEKRHNTSIDCGSDRIASAWNLPVVHKPHR
jgi:hypothetical protein